MTFTIRHKWVFALGSQEDDSEPRIRGLLIYTGSDHRERSDRTGSRRKTKKGNFTNQSPLWTTGA